MESHNKFQTRFNQLPVQSECTIAEYIWIGGSGNDIRSKTMCIPHICSKLEDFPIWNFDGSSTKQASTSDSEILLKPVFFCKDPFRQIDNSKEEAVSCLVLCETYKNDMTPAKANFRHYAEKIFKASAEEKPWFGFEQEYILLKNEKSHQRPLGFPRGGYAAPQGPYYCSVGASNSIGRYVAEAHLKCCLYAGLKVSGINAEVFPGQWEFQIGPVEGLNGCDQLWVARYILQRVCEEFGDVDVTFDPKPVKGDWNGSGCHTNFSFESTRKEGGYDRIIEAMSDLTKKHKDHILVYGEDNNQRLTGVHETAYIDKFNYGIANRGSSARIPTQTVLEKKGYFEDRRPAANCDPYLVGGMLVDTTILKGKYGDEVMTVYKKFVN